MDVPPQLPVQKHFLTLFLCAGILVGFTVPLVLFLSQQKPTSTQTKNMASVVTTNASSQKVSFLPESKEVTKEDASQEQDFSMIAMGDIMLGRYVETLMNQYGKNYPFEKISDFLKQGDMVLANLEGPITQNHSQTPNNSLVFSFSSPSAQAMADNHITHVSLANNHTLNQGNQGLSDTKNILQENHIAFFGHPAGITEEDILIEEKGERKIALIGLHATGSIDEEKAKKIVLQAAEEEDAFVIVVVHWGDEYKLTANGKQQHLAHDWIDAGTDLIIGHHPHVVQNIEEYNDRMIFYSLGNFIFDQYFSEETQQELSVKAVFTDNDVSYELVPIKSIRSQPQLMNEEEKKAFLEQLARRSDLDLKDSIQSGIIE